MSRLAGRPSKCKMNNSDTPPRSAADAPGLSTNPSDLVADDPRDSDKSATLIDKYPRALSKSATVSDQYPRASDKSATRMTNPSYLFVNHPRALGKFLTVRDYRSRAYQGSLPFTDNYSLAADKSVSFGDKYSLSKVRGGELGGRRTRYLVQLQKNTPVGIRTGRFCFGATQQMMRHSKMMMFTFRKTPKRNYFLG